jgi:hypothetical protein
MQHDISSFIRPLDLLSVSAHSWNVYNDLAFAAEEKSVEQYM